MRVAGRARDTRTRSVYLSGVPGTYYADGTFEFRGVPPGKHVLAGLDTDSPLGALIVVGDGDVTGIELLDEVSPVPFDIRAPRTPEPAGAIPPGMIPLASVQGTILDETTGNPVGDGDLRITGYSKTETFIVDKEGRYRIPRLFPGTYTVDVQSFGHETVSRTLTVGAENITFNVSTKRI